MKYFAFIYRYDPSNPALADVRPKHREFIGGLHDKGYILGSGPFPDDKGGALIVLKFATDSQDISAATELMNNDPFWKEGIVTDREVREWNPVINSL